MKMTFAEYFLLAAFACLGFADGQGQTEQLAKTKMEDFMASPVIGLNMWRDFYSFGGFPNYLQGADRELAIKFMYAMVRNSDHFTPFYGLENGLFLGYFQSESRAVPILTYREPGDNAYSRDEFETAIYYNTCVDNYDGSAQFCTMPEGTIYVSCRDDCELVSCGDLWCWNYSMETAVGNSLAYIPRSEYCINAQGTMSQTPGEIMRLTESGDVDLGNCTFGNGNLVDRHVWGPYASCGGDGVFCATTYAGAHSSFLFDPRVRDWYIGSKAVQRPRWSDPYVFSHTDQIGITFTVPINSTNEEGKIVFEGVLGADLLLGDISRFLADAVAGTDVHIAICEAADPHNMIGVSTQSEIVTRVRTDDPSQPCTEEESINGDCTVTQFTIQNLDATLEDDILRKAHMALQQVNFVLPDPSTSEILRVKESDEVTSKAYLVSYIPFAQKGSNLEWQIIATRPVARNEDDAIEKGETVFLIVCIFGCLGFVVCSTLVILFVLKRNERAVILADFKFTSAFIAGCAMLNLSSLTFLGEVTDQLCMLRMWAYFMIATMALSPLLVKALRTYMLLGASTTTAGKKTMSNFEAWIRTLPLPIAQIAILTVFTILDPPVATEEITRTAEGPTQSLRCLRDTEIFFYVEGAFFGLVIATGCYLAFLTRNIDPRFADAKALLFAMYNIAFTIIMFGAIFSLVPISESGLNLMTTVGVFWVTVFSSVLFVVPKLVEASQDKKKEKDTMAQLRTAHSQRQTRRFSSLNHSHRMHVVDGTLKVLVCSANMGNAEPTLESMKAWIPEDGATDEVMTLNGEIINSPRFDVIAIGMQEATWSSKKKKKGKDGTGTGSDRDPEMGDDDDNDENNILAALEGEDTVKLRKMEKSILGDAYRLVKEELRGQMRLYIWACVDLVPYLENVKVSGANTGIGNVLANKGGIVISFEYKKTRFTFLSAHLAAHEGDSYYQTRCENVYDILRTSKTHALSNHFDLSLTSHHMFVFGDLNFRTKFEGKAEHEQNVERALGLIEELDFRTLYSYDELHKGVKKGDLLLGFDTLPCRFHPTFKVEREAGFVYKKQRTPSYTDRILYKSGVGLEPFVKPLAYEPCVDFITSDHKPIRGAFSIAPNDMIDAVDLGCRFRLVFTDMECSNLPAGDVDGKSDPFLMFVWDGIDMIEEDRRGFRLPRLFSDRNWPRTNYISKTLNPRWDGKKIVLASTGHEVSSAGMLYVAAFDYDFGASDDVLGTLALNLRELVTGEGCKYLLFDRPLVANGKNAGRIKFKLEVTRFVG